ncbi:hypothetical protein LTR27_008069 [Elasticomyces elasticus]|nr:hypothetical protein LTR27_008069 [Elasticomyces elasticus]
MALFPCSYSIIKHGPAPQTPPSLGLRNASIQKSLPYRTDYQSTQHHGICFLYTDALALRSTSHDLKTAMQQKDKPRLNVLRSLLADVTNAAKTSSPIQSDMQMLSLLRKRLAAAEAAKKEFDGAGRKDLVEQEDAQAKVLENYMGGVETMGADSISEAVKAVVEEGKAAASGKVMVMGDVLKKLLGAGGSLEGKNVERSEVARVVKQMLGQQGA